MGSLLKANTSPGERRKKKTLLATKKLMLSYNPLDMDVLFETDFEHFQSWGLRDKVCEETRQHWLSCFFPHSLRNRANIKWQLK